jgi:predicted exporter
MSPRLVLCLALSILAALGAAIWALWAGWGGLAALAVYSIVGSTTLVGISLAAAFLVDLRDRPPVRRAEGTALPATAHSG